MKAGSHQPLLCAHRADAMSFVGGGVRLMLPRHPYYAELTEQGAARQRAFRPPLGIIGGSA